MFGYMTFNVKYYILSQILYEKKSVINWNLRLNHTLAKLYSCTFCLVLELSNKRRDTEMAGLKNTAD